MSLLPLTLQSQRLRLFFSILFLLVTGALIFAHFKRGPSEAATMVQSPAPIQAELRTITPAGFEPAELTRSKGRFLFANYNHPESQQSVQTYDYDRWGNRTINAAPNLGHRHQ